MKNDQLKWFELMKGSTNTRENNSCKSGSCSNEESTGLDGSTGPGF